MIIFKQKGDFSKTTRYLSRVKQNALDKIAKKCGDLGVQALASATPVATGLTASSWYYQVIHENGKMSINFCNSNIQKGVPIAIILQYGHGTRNGGWVQGRDYINPAIQPIFDAITNEAWKEVTKT